MILTTDQRMKLRLAELEILVLDQQRVIEELQATQINEMSDMAARPGAGPSGTEIEITPEMIEAGEGALMAELGGSDLGFVFSARELAIRVYVAMRREQLARLTSISRSETAKHEMSGGGSKIDYAAQATNGGGYD